MDLTIELSCRICMLSSDNLTSIFKQHEGRSISELISDFSGVQIEISDSLSQKICKECFEKAVELHAFRQLCIDSDDTVRFNILLADSCDSVIEAHEGVSDKLLLKADEMSTIEEEYFVQEDEEGHTEYDEIFEEDQFIDEVESSEDSQQRTVLIERVDAKTTASNSEIYNMETSELTAKMREAHFAREQLKKHKCPHCDKFFKFPSKVTRHVQAVHKNLEEPKRHIKKNHHCPICTKAFVSQFKVRRHMVVHDNELKIGLQKNWSKNVFFYCESCRKKFNTQTTFDRHLLICELLQKSSIERPRDHVYFCAICYQSYQSHDEMTDHIKSHPSKDYRCVACCGAPQPFNDIIRHGRYHEENVTYRCCFCQKTFPNGEEIIMHLLRHKDYKPFSCDECGKSFFDKYKLRQHLNTHDPNAPKNFVCEFCEKTFGALDYLNCHIRRKHSTVKPYQCSYCKKAFAFVHDLNLHSGIHTGDKKHICHICDASFTKAYSLKQHLVIHQDDPTNLQCNICGFSASTISRLREHQANHVKPEDETLEVSQFVLMEGEISDQEGYLEEIQQVY